MEKGSEGDLEKAKDDCGDADADLGRAISLGPVDVSALEEEISGRERLGNQKITKAGLGNQKNTKAESQDTKNKSENALEIDKSFVWDQESSGSTINDFEIENKDTFVQEKEIYLGESSIEVMPMAESDNSFCQDEGGGFGHDANEIVSGVVSVQSQEKENYPEKSNLDVEASAKDTSAVCQDKENYSQNSTKEDVAQCENALGQDKDNASENTEMEFVTENDNGLDQGKENDPENVVNEVSVENKNTFCQGKENYSESTIQEAVILSGSAIDEDRDNEAENIRMEIDGLDQYKDNYPEHFGHDVAIESENTVHQNKEKDSESTIQEALTQSGSAIDEDRDNEAENTGMEIEKESDNGLDQNKENYPEHSVLDVAIESDNTVHEDKVKDSENTTKEFAREAVDISDDNEDGNSIGGQSDCLILDEMGTSDWEKEEEVSIADGSQSEGNISSCSVDVKCSSHCQEKGSDVTGVQKLDVKGQNVPAINQGGPSTSTKKSQSPSSDQTPVKETNLNSNQGGPSTSTKKSQSPSSDQTPVKETNLNRSGNGEEATVSSNGSKISVKKDKATTVFLTEGNFQKVVLVADPYYEQELRKLETEHVKLVLVKGLKPNNLSTCIKEKKRSFGKKVLWVYVSGILNVTDLKEDCRCYKPLSKVAIDTSFRRSNHTSRFTVFSDINCIVEAQKELGIEGVLAIIPPIPSAVIIKPLMKHSALHELSNKLHAPLAYVNDAELLKKLYEEYCYSWSNMAHSKLSLFSTSPYLDFGKKTYWLNLIFGISENCSMHALRLWRILIRKFFNVVFSTSFPKEKIMAPLIYSGNRYDQIVIICDGKNLDMLQEATKDMPVAYCNQFLDLDRSGVASITSISSKLPDKTLYLVITGFSEIASIDQNAIPNCRKGICSNPLVVYALRNNIESINFDRMLCNIMKSTAEMVIIANKALPQESGLLLCPLVPLRGFFLNSIMIEHHSYLHKEYMKNPDVPMFIGSKCRWNTNANCFEKLWLSLLKGIHANPEVLEKTIEKYNKGIHQFDFASMKEESPSKKEESPSKKEESPLKKEESPSKKESLSSPVLKNWTDMMVELLKYYLSLTENDPILFNIDGAISFMKMILDKKKAAGDPKEEVDPTVLSLMNKACSCSGDIKCNLHQGDEKTINKSASAPDVGTSQMHSMHDETTLQTMTGTTSVEQIVIESLVDSFNPVSKFQRSARLEALKAAKNGFEKIVFLGSNLYKDILKDFEKLDENVILMLANSMKFEDLRSIIHSQKRKIGKKTLWILVSGIWSVAIDEKEPSCDKCSILKATNSFKECQEPVGDMMRLCLTEVNSCMQELQRELGNNGIIILAPPIPTYAIKSSSCHHKTLHEIVDMDPIPLIQREEVEMLKNVYDTFCAFWTKLACLIAQDVIPLVFKFDQFCKNNCGHNFKLISNKPEIKAHSKWKEFMKTIILGLCPTKLESTSGKLSTKLETASLVSTWMFERIVIVGYTEHLGKLQEETKDMPVSFVNENVDLDDSLVAAIQRIKDKWPGTHNILFLIMTSISRLCYFLSDGNPKCAASNCKFRLPSYVMKNKPQGDPFYKTWYGVDMVEDIVELSFCSIARADKSMPKGSRVLLAPLVPVQAFVMDTPYLGTHAEIHKTYEKNPKFPLLMGPYHAWSSCSQNFNNKWLDVIKCIHTHHNFTNIFNYIELRNIMVDCLSPVSTPHQKHVDKRWTKIMISLLRFYTSLKESDPVPFKPFEDTGRRARESKNQGGVTRVTEPSQPSGESVAKFPELVTLSKPTGERVAKPPELVTPSYNPSSAPSLVFNNPETVNNPSSATHLALHPSNDIPSPMSNISCQPPSNNVPPYEPHQFPPPFFSNVPPPSLTPISNVAPPSLTPISNVTPPSLTPISNVPPYTSGMSQPPSYNVPHPSLPPISNVPPCTPVVSQLPLHNVPPYGPNASQTPFSNVSPHTPVMSQPPITIVSHLGPGAAQPPFSNVPPHAPGMSEFPYSSVPLLGPDASQPPFSNVPSHLPDVSHPTFSSIPPYVPSMPPPPLSDPNTFPNNSVSTPSGLPMHQVSAFPQSVVTTPSPVSNFTIPHQSISTTPASGHPIGLSPSTVSLQTTASITSSLEVSPSPVLTESSTTSQVTPKQASVNGRIIVQNIQTELNLSQVKDVLKIFGSLESFNWPGGGERKTGGFIMASYANEVSARRSSRILSHLQVFGVTSTIKIFGVDHDGVLPELEDEDMEYLLKVHETLADFKKGEKMTKTVDKSTNVGQSLHVQETTKASPLDDLHKVLPPERERKSTAPGIIAPSGLGIPLPKQETSSPSIKGIPLPEQETSSPSVLGAPLPKQKTSNPSIKRIPIPRQKTSSPAVTVIVNISEYVSYWALDTMFSEIGAQRKGVVKGNCLHYEFSEYNAVVKVLDGLRILDLKMEVQLHSGDKDEFVVHSEAKKGADILMGPLTRLKDWVVQTVKDKLMKELNVYTFKTEACSLGMQCDNKYNCPKYHDKADRRRNPKSYNYCVMRCSNLEGTGACDFEDRCYYLHSIQEKLLHFSCYKNEICTLGLKKCQEMKRTCYDAHSDEPDSFYHSTWEQPLYVKGLDRTLDYLAGAVRNLFKFHKLPGSKVLLITSTMGMAEFYARCIKDLAESYHQTVAVYDEKKKSCDGTIIIATEIPPLDYKRKKCVVLGKNIDLQTLKALIIDDGPAVLRNVPKNRIYDLQRIYGIEGLNIVVTAEEIINAEILHAFHMLGSRKSFKTIYFPCSATDDPTKQNKSPSSSTISNSENDKFSLSSSSRTRSDHSSQSPQLSLKDRIRMSSLHSMDSRSKNSPVMLGASSMKDSDDKSRFRTDGRKERYVDEKSSFRSHSRSISPPSRSRSPPSRSRSPLSKSRSPPSRSRSPSETQSRRRLPVRSKSPSETQSRKRLPVRSKSPSETQSKRRLPVRSKSPSIYRSKERSSPRPGSSSMFLESRGSPPRSRSMSEQSRRSPPRQKDDNHKQKILDEERRLECRKSTRKDDVEQSKAGGWKDLSHIEERLLKGGKSLQRCWKVFRAAFEELKVEYDREIELYTETPEVHPDYEEQYSSFIEYYKKEFTEKHDMTHCETLWEIYWKELISDMLEGEYRNKVEDLKREIVTPALNEAKENQKLNSKEESEFHKSRYTDHYGKIVTGETTGGSDVEEDSFIRNTFGLLQDACPFLGELSQDLMPLIYDIQMCIGDRTRFCELLQKSENIRLLKIVYNKCLEVSGRELSSELELKLQLAMVQIQRLLDFVEHINTKEKRNIKSEGSERSAQKYHRNQSPPLKSEPVTKSTRNQPRNQSPPYKSGLSDELAEAQHRNQGLKTSANVPQFSKEELQHLSYDPKEFSVKETVNILSEMSPCAGVLAPVLQILIGKLRDCMLDDSLMSSILSDKDNKMVLEMISEMFQKQSKRENNAIKVQKLELARSQMLRLLDYTNPVATKVIEVKPSVQIYTRIDNVQGSNTSQKHSTHSDSTRYFAQSSATISTLSQENCSISEYVFAKHYADKGASFNKDDLDNPIASTSAFGKEQKSGDSSTENFLVKSLILLEEVSSSFGLMGCVAQSLFQKIRLFWSDNRKVCEVITNRDNIILVKQVSERCKMLSENTTNPVQAKKYQWASILAMELLSYPDYVAKR